MDTLIDIGSRRELFVDPALIDRLDGARLALHRPQPQEVSVVFDAPWEASAPGYATVFRDGDRYRLYYRAAPAACQDCDARQLTCYAESDDGIRWRKPDLGLFEFQGSKRNNVVWQGVMSHNFTPFRDDRPGCSPAERYKAVGGCNAKWGGGEGLVALASPDGIQWRRMAGQPLSLAGNFDSQNLIFWDAAAGCYRAFWRDHRRRDPRIPEGRDVKTATSADLRQWSEPQWLDYEPNRSGSPELDQTDDPSGDHHQFYCGGVLPYPRAPHLLLGFPQRYVDRGWTASTDALPEIGRRRELAARNAGGGRPTREGTVASDVLFMAGRDARKFFVWPEAFVRPGIQRPGSWYYGDAWIAWGLVETAGRDAGAPSDLSVYIQQSEHRDGPGRLRRHTLRMDGFGSVCAPLTGGTMTTRPFTFAGNRLEINFSSSAGGRLRIEIRDKEGRGLPGYGIDDCHLQYGDQLDREVSWKGGADVGALAGRPVRLHVELKDADLYALRFH